MKTVSMSGSLRENVGKKDAKVLRRQGLVPCVMYGGEGQVKFSVEQKAFKPLLFTPETHYVDIIIDGKETRCILQDIQYHPVTSEVMHADFLRIFDDKAITISVPVKTSGHSVGVIQGGKLAIKIRKLILKGLPNDIPQEVTLDITKLAIGQGIKVEEISIPKVEILNVKSSYVLIVRTTRQAVADDSAAATEGETAATEGAENSEADKDKKE